MASTHSRPGGDPAGDAHDAHADHSHGGGDLIGHAAHGHAGHSHAPASFGRAFAIGISLNLIYVTVEAVFGLRIGSMALLADAGHNLSDVLGLVVAWGGATLARRSPTVRRTYGLRSSTIVAALANAVFLLIAIGAIGWEAVGRLRSPEPLAGGTIAWVAGVGIVVNALTAWFFMSGRKHDLNIRGAYLHMAADAAVSAGVVVAGLTIAATGWLWLDPAISLGVALLIGASTWGLLRDSVHLALNAVPSHIDPDAVRDFLAGLPGVREVHDLHIWGMSTTEVALTAHVVRPRVEDEDALLVGVSRALRDRFGIAHATVQIERGNGPHGCDLAPVDVV
ncbi:cation diffusion facilitator family transporter [Gemmatimonas sp.]